MVRLGYFSVYMTLVWCPVAAAHDVVYPHVHASTVVGKTGTVAAGDVAIVKLAGYPPMGVADGGVVEVATQDDTLVAVGSYECCYAVGLRSAQPC